MAVRTWFPLEVGTRLVLLLRRNKDDTVLQITGTVSKAASRKSHHYVEVRIPWDDAVTLAVWAGKTVEDGDKVVLHDYVVQIKDVSPPPLR
jgi:hypothetical protein